MHGAAQETVDAARLPAGRRLRESTRQRTLWGKQVAAEKSQKSESFGRGDWMAPPCLPGSAGASGLLRPRTMHAKRRAGVRGRSCSPQRVTGVHHTPARAPLRPLTGGRAVGGAGWRNPFGAREPRRRDRRRVPPARALSVFENAQ